MSRSSIADLPLPIRDRAQLKAALRLVADLRRDPGVILAWDPAAEQPLPERQRHELALALELVLSLGTGDGDLEARVRACQQLYMRHLTAPAEAVRAGELLFKSRITCGATDVETFWLAVSFAFALYPLADHDTRELAWRYLCHAPFALDPSTALKFARASRGIHRDRFPRWPLELAESLISRAEHADLGATLLEAVVCAHLDSRVMEEAADKLQQPLKRPDPQLIQAIEQLARYYVRTEAEQVHAREVIRAAARTIDDAAPLVIYLSEQRFDLPHEELYGMVRANQNAPDFLDALYRDYVESGRLHLARRLIECELVRRLDPWYFGGIQPHVKRAIVRVIGGADVSDPRVRELAVRLAILHSRTRHFTEEAEHLARRIAVLPDYLASDTPVKALREELEDYLRDSDPAALLEREREVIRDRWDELDESERRVMGDVQAWMEKRFHPRVEMLRAASDGVPSPLTDAAMAVGVDRGVERAVEKALWRVYRSIYQPERVEALRREIERLIGHPYARMPEADVARVNVLARSFAAQDRTLGLLSGAVAGLVGGPWGLAMDAVSLLMISTRAAARIGACFGIEPGTRQGFEFLLNALLMSVSTEAGEGLVAYLIDQRPRLYRALTVGGVNYTIGATRRALRDGSPDGLGGSVADRIKRASRAIGLGLTQRQWARMLPVVGAVITAGADYLFLRELTDAALHLAARQWVLSRHGLLVSRTGTGTLYPEVPIEEPPITSPEVEETL